MTALTSGICRGACCVRSARFSYWTSPCPMRFTRSYARWVCAPVSRSSPGGGAAAIGTVVRWARSRHLDVLAALVVGLFVLGGVTALVSGDARYALAKESALTGLAGISASGRCSWVDHSSSIYAASSPRTVGGETAIGSTRSTFAVRAGG